MDVNGGSIIQYHFFAAAFLAAFSTHDARNVAAKTQIPEQVYKTFRMGEGGLVIG